MAVKNKLEAQNPLILRSQRLVEAFAKSDDERDFYLDRLEGFLIYVDLSKPEHDLKTLEKELISHNDRYCMIPKLTFYETKKIMEGFVNEKVYDIDTKEKLLDIIQSKEARENFLEFIYDHHSELEKWQQYYQERSRIRIIEWLRVNHYHFVFEEDLDIPKSLIEKLKRELFDSKASKEVIAARKGLIAKAKTYYSNEALNPRPKRGRPPKQAVKLEIEPQISTDIFTTVPVEVRPFLFTPDYTSATILFSSKFDNEEELLASRKAQLQTAPDKSMENLAQKLASLRSISSRWLENEEKKQTLQTVPSTKQDELEFDEDDGEEENVFDEYSIAKPKDSVKKINGQKGTKKTIKKTVQPVLPIKKPSKVEKSNKTTKQTPKPKAKIQPPSKKKARFRSIIKPKKLMTKASPKKAGAVKKNVIKKTPAKKPIGKKK